MRLALHGLRVNFDPADVGVSALAVTTAGSKVDESDLVDLREVHFVEQNALGLNLFDIQFEPANLAEVELRFVKVEGESVCMISHEERAIGQLKDGTNLMETGRLRIPADSRLAGEIGIALFVTKDDGASCRAKPGPDVRHAAFIVD